MQFIDYASAIKYAMGPMDQTELAERTGINRSQISRFLSGVVIPHARHLDKISGATGRMICLDITVKDVSATRLEFDTIERMENLGILPAGSLAAALKNFDKIWKRG